MNSLMKENLYGCATIAEFAGSYRASDRYRYEADKMMDLVNN